MVLLSEMGEAGLDRDPIFSKKFGIQTKPRRKIAVFLKTARTNRRDG